MAGTETTTASPVAHNIRLAQAHAGLSNKALAVRVGVDIRLLQKWRAGDSEPRYENLLKLAEALDHDVSWFYEDETKAAA